MRAAGLAVNDEELAPDLYAIAAPVRNEAREVVAAVEPGGADSSMISLQELVDALGPHLVSTADRISARLGYRRDDERQLSSTARARARPRPPRHMRRPVAYALAPA